MDEGLIIVIIVVCYVWYSVKKAKKNAPKQASESSAMPHQHRKPGQYDTHNPKRRDNSNGTIPHEHATNALRKRVDVASLPKGYILLNGEPVKVSDLENK